MLGLRFKGQDIIHYRLGTHLCVGDTILYRLGAHLCVGDTILYSLGAFLYSLGIYLCGRQRYLTCTELLLQGDYFFAGGSIFLNVGEFSVGVAGYFLPEIELAMRVCCPLTYHLLHVIVSYRFVSVYGTHIYCIYHRSNTFT
jgi:hypothetical protein